MDLSSVSLGGVGMNSVNLNVVGGNVVVDNIPNNAIMDSNGFYLLDKDGYWLTSTESV